MSVLALGPLVPTVAASAYFYNCDGTARSSFDAISKNVTATAFYIKAAAGDVTVRQLAPCNPIGTVFGSQWDEPFVLGATIQDYNSDTTNNIVQIGYARCGYPSGIGANCGGVPADNNMYLVYTNSDHAGGAEHLATWYHQGLKLTPGDRFRMKISRVTSGCPIGEADCWQFCARNISIGEAYICRTIAYTWGTCCGGNLAWWGSETNNNASQMGAAASGLDFNMDYMQYLTTQAGAAWTVRTGMPACDVPTGPSWYHCSITSTVYSSDTLFAFTALH